MLGSFSHRIGVVRSYPRKSEIVREDDPADHVYEVVAVTVSLPSAKSGNIRRWQKLRSAGARRPSCSRKMRHGGSRRILPSCRSCCAKRESMQHRLCVGFVKKGDQGRKTGAAFRAVPNVTRVVVAPILRPYGRNQLSIALNATQHVTLPTNTRR
jgi:hypothetical protein